MSSMVTISCGRSASSRQSNQLKSNSLGAFMPQKFSTQSGGYRRRSKVGNKIQPKDFNSSYSPSNIVAMKPNGRWTMKLRVTNNNTVVHTSRIQPRAKVSPQVKKFDRPCAYCKEDGCHIRTCEKLKMKNSLKSSSKKASKNAYMEMASARLAARVRQAQEEIEREVLAEQEDSDIDSDEDSSCNGAPSSQEEEVDDFPALPTVAKNDTRRVTFKNDSENLMKPPCDTKVYDINSTPISISDEEDEEEEITLKSSSNAWKPKSRQQTSGMSSQERQVIVDEINEKETELSSYSTDCWADACEIEELEDEIKVLKAKLA